MTKPPLSRTLEEGLEAMTLTIEPDKRSEGAWKAKAAAQGLTVEAWLKKLADEDAAVESREVRKPRKTGWATLGQYGPAPSQEEILENRREMFRDFPRDVE